MPRKPRKSPVAEHITAVEAETAPVMTPAQAEAAAERFEAEASALKPLTSEELLARPVEQLPQEAMEPEEKPAPKKLYSTRPCMSPFGRVGLHHLRKPLRAAGPTEVRDGLVSSRPHSG